jgi:hypothetical protein
MVRAFLILFLTFLLLPAAFLFFFVFFFLFFDLQIACDRFVFRLAFFG